jgi:hypothetical protein
MVIRRCSRLADHRTRLLLDRAGRLVCRRVPWCCVSWVGSHLIGCRGWTPFLTIPPPCQVNHTHGIHYILQATPLVAMTTTCLDSCCTGRCSPPFHRNATESTLRGLRLSMVTRTSVMRRVVSVSHVTVFPEGLDFVTTLVSTKTAY